MRQRFHRWLACAGVTLGLIVFLPARSFAQG
jgi:hypothetical protein